MKHRGPEMLQPRLIWSNCKRSFLKYEFHANMFKSTVVPKQALVSKLVPRFGLTETEFALVSISLSDCPEWDQQT